MVSGTAVCTDRMRDGLTNDRASVTMATQSWLAETSDSKKSAATPAIFSVGMSCMFSSLPVPRSWSFC